jgi:hypothetical protein
MDRPAFLVRYVSASLDAIAEEAGFSKGVVDSQFARRGSPIAPSRTSGSRPGSTARTSPRQSPRWPWRCGAPELSER